MFHAQARDRIAGLVLAFAAWLVGGPPASGAEVPEFLCGRNFLREPGGLFRIASGKGAPGEEVQLPLFATPDWDTGGFAAVLDFDEEALEVRRIEQVFRSGEAEWGYKFFDFSNENAAPGNAGVCDEGFIIASGAIFEGFDERGIPNVPSVVLPRGVETEVVRVVFRVRPGAPPGPTWIRFQNSAPDRSLPPSGRTYKSSIGSEDGEGNRTVNVVHGFIEVEGSAIDVPALRRFSLGGLGDLVTKVAPRGTNIAISALSPAGDADGDGREDLLIRGTRSGAAGAEDEEVVVLLYGFTSPRRDVDPFADSVRKTVIHTPATHLNRPDGLGGGEDLDGDGFDDFCVSVGPGGGRDSSLLLVHGGRSLPGDIRIEDVGVTVRGSVIFDSVPATAGEIVGRLAAMSPDLDGDARADLVIVETGELLERRRAFVLCGSNSLPPVIDLQAVGGPVPGSVLEASGAAVDILDDLVPLGDVDADGIADLGIVGGSSGGVGSGRYLGLILYGGPHLTGRVIVVDDLPAGQATRLVSYSAMARGGDVDGDGHEDPVLFQVRGEVGSGEAHILRGRPRAEMLASITAETFHADGLGLAVAEELDSQEIEGIGTSTLLNLTRGRDADGDGKAEVFLAAVDRNVNYGHAAVHAAGSAFVLRGSAMLSGRVVTTDIADGRGVRLDGIEPGGSLGFRGFVLEGFCGRGGVDHLLASRRGGCAALQGEPTSRGHDLQLWIVPGRAVLSEDLVPRLERIHPARGSLQGGSVVVLFGVGFGLAPRVFFGDRPARLVNSFGDGLLAVEAPPQSIPLAVPVRVQTDAGETQRAVEFTYFDGGQSVLDPDSSPQRVVTIRHLTTIGARYRGMAEGDFNGDGNPDLAAVCFIQPTEGAGEARSSLSLIAGEGKRSDAVDIDSLEPPQGATLWSFPMYLQRGHASAVESGGDTNADGFDDMVVSLASGGSGEWRLILGRPVFPHDLLLDDLPDVVRFTWGGWVFDTEAASHVVPDLDGDGFDDLLLTSSMAGASDRVRLLHVVRGRAAFPPEIDLATLAEDGNGVTFSTTIGLTELAGPAGDFNGDGRQDIFFAGAGCLGEGAVLVLYGGPEMFRQEGVVTLGPDQVHDVGGLLVSGPGLFSGLDPWATIPGDLDRDGHVDLFLRQSNSAGCTLSPASGAGFILDREAVLRDGLDPERFPLIVALYGDTDVGYPDMVVSWAERQEGVLRLQGGLLGYDLGVLAAPAGDFNGDGYLDLAIGSAAGPVSVLFGSADLESLDLEIPDLSGRTITIKTAAEHCAGGFDWDKDGIGDIALASADATFRIVFGALRVGGQFVRGDADDSGYLNLSDPIVILGYLFLGNAPLGCLDAGDADDDGVLILTDAIYVLSYLFLGGPAPSSPFPDPGLDPTDDLLSCGARGLGG